MKKGFSKKWLITLVILFFLILGVVYSSPLIHYFNQGIPYSRFPGAGQEIQRMRMGDHLNLYYNFWLLKNNILHLRNPFSDPYQFYYWGKRFFNPQIGLFSVIFAIFSPFGNVIAFNLVFLLSFILAGTIAFLWLEKSGLSLWPALIGGIIFCLAPHRLSQMCGHINGLFYFSFPLLLYFAESMIQSQKKRYPLLLGLTILIMAWTEYHIFYYSVLFLAPFVLFMILILLSPNEDGSTGQNVTLLFLEGTGVSVLIATLAFQYGWPYGKYYFTLLPIFIAGFYFFITTLLKIINRVIFIGDKHIILPDIITSFLSPLSLFILLPIKIWFPIPQYGHALIAFVLLGMAYTLYTKRHLFSEFHLHRDIPKGILTRFFPVLPFFLIGGAATIFIKRVVFGGSIAEKGRRLAEIRHFSPHMVNLIQRVNYDGESMIYLGWVSCFLMALGLWFLIKERYRESGKDPLERRAKFWFGTFFLATFLSLGLTVPRVPLYAFFYKFIPYFKYPRVPGRMIFISYAAMAFCVAWAIERAKFRKRWLRTALVGAVTVGILIDYHPPRPLGLCLLDRGKTPYEKLEKKDMPPKTVLELPLWPGDTAWSSIYQYYVTRYQYPMVNGYSPAVSREYVKDVFYGLYPMDVGEVTEKSLNMLKRLHVQYVTFHTNAYPFKISPFPARLILNRLKSLPFLKLVGISPYITLFKLFAPLRKSKIKWKYLESIDSPVGVLWEAERCRHNIGKVIKDPQASDEAALFVKGKRKGMMMGAQYRLFPCGFYDGIIRIKKFKNDLSDTCPIGYILIAGLHQKTPLFKKNIVGSDLKGRKYSDIRFSFHVPYAQRIECTIYSYGKTPLSLDYAFFSFHGRGEGPATFQAENLFHQGRITSLPMNEKKGKCVRFSPDIINDRAIHGPFHRLSTGKYQATFWMAVNGKVPAETPMVELRVTRGTKGEILAVKRLRKRDWEKTQTLEPFSLTFKLDRPSIIEFPVFYQGKGILWVDRIKVTRS